MSKFTFLRKPLKPLLIALLLVLSSTAMFIFCLQSLLDGLVMEHCMNSAAYVGTLYSRTQEYPLLKDIPADVLQALEDSDTVADVMVVPVYSARAEGLTCVLDGFGTKQSLNQILLVEGVVEESYPLTRGQFGMYETFPLNITSVWGGRWSRNAMMVYIFRAFDTKEPQFKAGDHVFLDNQRSVDEMYQSVQLTFQVLPGADGAMNLRNKTVRKLQSIEGVSNCFYYFECPYSLREPMAIPNFSAVYGVNDLPFFSEERGVEITYGDGWDAQSVLTFEKDAPIPCILEINLAAVLGVETGDTFVVAPNAGQNTDTEFAPSLTMVVAGTFTDQAGLAKLYSILVYCDTFILGRPCFLYDQAMTNSYYRYQVFHFQIDPSYNRDFQRIKEEADSILKDGGSFILFSNVRILEQAVRPIEQKIHIQQMLVTPLSILLCVAAAVVSVFLCTGFSSEVFLRLLWGEKRPVVWLSMVGSLVVLMAGEGAAALLVVWLVSGTKWLVWAARYLLLAVGLCVAAATVQQAVFCGKNLVAFYQSRED